MTRNVFLIVVVALLISACKKDDAVFPPDSSIRQQSIDWPGLAATPWPMFMHDPQLTGRSPYLGPQFGVVQWNFDATSWVYSPPVIDNDGTVYFGSDDGYLYAVNSGGSLKWKFMTAGGIRSSPLISADGTIYVGQGSSLTSVNGALYALDRSGSLKWKFDLDGYPGFCSPTISKDGQTVYVSSGDATNYPRKFYAIGSDGMLRWTFGGLPGEDALYNYTPAFSPDGETLYLSGVQKLFAVDTSGNERWEYSAGGELSAPCVDNEGYIYVAGRSLFCFRPNGILIWSHSITGMNEPPMPGIGWDGTVYLVFYEVGPSAATYLHAYEHDGMLKWLQSVGNFSQGNPVIDKEGTVYVGSNGRFPMGAPHDSTSLFAFHPDGQIRFKLTLHAADGTVPDVSSTPAIGPGNRLYVGSDRSHGRSLFSIY